MASRPLVTTEPLSATRPWRERVHWGTGSPSLTTTSMTIGATTTETGGFRAYASWVTTVTNWLKLFRTSLGSVHARATPLTNAAGCDRIHWDMAMLSAPGKIATRV